MPLRKRLSIVAAAAVAVAVVLVAFVCYFVVRQQLLGQIDASLRAEPATVRSIQDLSPPPGPPAGEGGPAPYYEIVFPNGTGRGNIALPVTSETLAVAEGNANTYLSTVTVDGATLREITWSASLNGIQPVAIEVARPLDSTYRILAHLRLILLLLSAAGIAIAAILGRAAAGRVLSPLAEAAQTAEHISETEDLSSRMHVHADDEVGALARRFNAMMERLQGSRAALDDSVRAQRQLVADASHELRTPVTSLRTNVEVLLAGDTLSGEDRRRLLEDMVEQSEELSALVNDLIELARGDLPVEHAEDVRLDRVAEESLARARRNSPRVNFVATLEPVIVEGVPDRLGRAINNLLDNAARHSPPGAEVELTIDTSGARVRDHGTGVAEADLPYVFDRFYRGTNSRGRQGSGLGLSIVRQVAVQHGGSVSVANAPDGGAIFSMHLPAAPSEVASGGQIRDDESPTKVSARPPAPTTQAPTARR